MWYMKFTQDFKDLSLEKEHKIPEFYVDYKLV